MSMHRLIVTSAAAMSMALSGALFAQTAAQNNAATVTQEQANKAAKPVDPAPPGSAEAYKHQKVDEATAADAKFHANRTGANMQARDRAEAEAAVAIDKANGPNHVVQP